MPPRLLRHDDAANACAPGHHNAAMIDFTIFFIFLCSRGFRCARLLISHRRATGWAPRIRLCHLATPLVHRNFIVADSSGILIGAVEAVTLRAAFSQEKPLIVELG